MRNVNTLASLAVWFSATTSYYLDFLGNQNLTPRNSKGRKRTVTTAQQKRNKVKRKNKRR